MAPRRASWPGGGPPSIQEALRPRRPRFRPAACAARIPATCAARVMAWTFGQALRTRRTARSPRPIPPACGSERARAFTVPGNGHKRSHEEPAMSSRIEDYAMIGDGRTGALVSQDGSIVWLCLPRFDSDACCAALLGRREHGFWRIAPCHPATQHRAYSGDTLVLETEFEGETGCIRLTDFMPIHTAQPVIVRRIQGLRGTTRIRCELGLRFDYGHVQPRIRRDGDAIVAVVGPDLLVLRGPVAPQPNEDGVLT